MLNISAVHEPVANLRADTVSTCIRSRTEWPLGGQRLKVGLHQAQHHPGHIRRRRRGVRAGIAPLSVVLWQPLA